MYTVKMAVKLPDNECRLARVGKGTYSKGVVVSATESTYSI